MTAQAATCSQLADAAQNITLQRAKLKSKIKAAAESICTQGTPVERIYFFASSLVPIADRHAVQAFVHDAYQVKLEIVDGLRSLIRVGT